MHNKIAAVIVTYNRKNLLKKCVEHVLSQSVSNVDALIIDNASTDGTNELVNQLFETNERVHYVNTGANLGGAGGFSYGIRWAVEHGYDYLWIMDDDTIPETDALKEFVASDKLLNGKYGFLASYVKWIDGTPCEMNVPSISQEWRNNIAQQFDNSMIRLDTASFVSIFIKASTVRRVGLPIKEFFIWGDDMEYTKRISKNLPCYFVYKSQVTHEMASNKATDIESADSDRLNRFEKLYRNRYYIVKQHGSKRERLFFWAGIKNTIRDILKSDCKDKMRRCRIVISSSLKGLRFNPEIEYVKKV